LPGKDFKDLSGLVESRRKQSGEEEREEKRKRNGEEEESYIKKTKPRRIWPER